MTTSRNKHNEEAREIDHFQHKFLAILEVIAITLYEGNENMANNFDRLITNIDRIADEITNISAAIRNPATGPNDQATIDNLTSRLDAAATALQQATADENLEDAGTSSVSSANNNPDPASAPANDPAPAGGEASSVANSPTP